MREAGCRLLVHELEPVLTAAAHHMLHVPVLVEEDGKPRETPFRA